MVKAELKPFLPASHDLKKEKACIVDEDILNKFQIGDHFELRYKVGAGGGHVLSIKKLKFELKYELHVKEVLLKSQSFEE